MVGYVFQSYLEEIPKPTIQKITLSVENATIQKNSVASIGITIEPQEASQNEIIWTSSDENIITIENGIIRAVNNGTATITASSSDKSVSDSLEITVITPASGLLLSKEEVQLLVGKQVKIIANVLPEDASNTQVTWSTKNAQIATVDANGLVTAVGIGQTQIIAKTVDGNITAQCEIIVKELPEGTKIEFAPSLRVENDEISNINLEKSTVKEIKELITTDLQIEIYNSDNQLLEETDKIGTGSVLILKDENGDEIYHYTFIIYGDVNGDGEINSLDALVVQKHILETKLLTGDFLKAGNTNKNGSLPNSLDVLRIQRHILETKFIQQ